MLIFFAVSSLNFYYDKFNKFDTKSVPKFRQRVRLLAWSSFQRSPVNAHRSRFFCAYLREI